MSYTKDVGVVSAIRRLVGEPPELNMVSGTNVRLVAPGSVTNRQFGLFEWNMGPQGGGPDAHFHKTFSESFYVTRGTIGLFDGAEWVDATPGDFLYVAEGGIHAFHNLSNISAQRGKAWTDYVVELVTHCPYAMARHLEGFSGALAVIRDYKLLTDSLLRQSHLPRIVLEDCSGGWEGCYQQIEAFLGLA